MALGVGSLIAVVLSGDGGGALCQNAWTYHIGLYPVAVSAAQIAEAWWNHVKAAYRAMATTGYGSAFLSVSVREMDSLTGALGSYSVPLAEQNGTRTVTGDNVVASFIAVGAKLNVPSRVTRPGSKRFWGWGEADLNGQSVSVTAQTVAQAVLNVAAAPIVLGAPAALVELAPVVVKRDPSTGLPLAEQPVAGAVVKPLVTSQVSRKLGRGA